MSQPEKTVWCLGCGVEIYWSPFLVGSQAYCCRDCSRSRRCACGERMELEEDRRGSSAQEVASFIPG